jgi:hypothetical protein
MYMTFRNMTAEPGKMPEAVMLLQRVAARLNSEHGGSFGVSMNVGGDPTALALASPWASLGDYEAARNSMAGDADIQGAIRMASGLITSANDTIAKIHVPPGERSAYASVNTAMMRLPSITDAVGLALEIADHVTTNHGVQVGVLTAITGPRAGLMWLSHADSMAALGELGEALTGDATYMEFFKRSDGLFADGSLEASIWQML